MKYTPLNDDRLLATRQYRALYSLCCSQEEQLSNMRKQVASLRNSLKLVDRAELDALYSENERLTNLLEEKISYD